MKNLKPNIPNHKFGITFTKNIYRRCYNKVTTIYASCIFYFNQVKHGSFNSIGLPFIEVGRNATCILGNQFAMVNNPRYATLGRSNRCKIVVYAGAKLIIGDNVGMSNSTIIATQSVNIGNNILIGGGVTIVDSDFHSFNPAHWHTSLDESNMKMGPVIISNNVFIGMDSIILKGVTIGNNVIVAAGSVVSSNIPDNEIWGGNPAKFIKFNKHKYEQ
jgi:acetyltransferase-like isoleucine patch superfamily enzyme